MDLHSELGAGRATGTRQVTLFVPSVDRSGAGIDQDYWGTEALQVFGRLFRGATAFPPARGVWRDDERGGKLVFDDTRMVMSYVEPVLLDDAATVAALRRFLHRLGRETNQGEVGIVIDGIYYPIVDFDEEEGAHG
ncbi:MAG TPA: hypothetical protein VHN37_05135 [Actinomycetota bacterium]|nr:hypothetical protein [Actinomycetota bacterium]